MKFKVWKRPDFGDIAQWHVVDEASALETARLLEEAVHQHDCNCSTAVLPEGEVPAGYERELALIRRGW
jgi:hypothetical protein